MATFTVGKNPLTPTYDSMNEELYVPNSGYNNVSVLPGQVPYQLFVADFTESGLPLPVQIGWYPWTELHTGNASHRS